MADDERPEVVYANQVQVTSGPFDLVMDFSFRVPNDDDKETGKSVARVAMSLSHAKTMLPLLAGLIARYEDTVGTIPAPNFEDRTVEDE